MKHFKAIFISILFCIVVNSCEKEDPPEGIEDPNIEIPVEEAFPGMQGEIMDFIIGEDTITVEKINDKYVFQGDILLTEDQLTTGSKKGAGINSFIKRWPCNTVYYKNSFAAKEAQIKAAMQHIETYSNLKFIERIDQDNYIDFVSGSGNSSWLGMIGGRQEITLTGGAPTGTVIHEICHALGIIHEHCKEGRDADIIVLFDNIKSKKGHNFYKTKTRYEIDRFDFYSIMLYHSFAWSKNSDPTIIKKDSTTFESQRVALSNDDISMLNLIYPPLEECVDISSTVTYKSCDYAKLESLITTICDSEIIGRGVYWGTEQNPESTGTKIEYGSGAGTYFASINDLDTDVTYYAKAYAISECDTIFGNEVNFTTPKCQDECDPFENDCVAFYQNSVYGYDEEVDLYTDYFIYDLDLQIDIGTSNGVTNGTISIFGDILYWSSYTNKWYVTPWSFPSMPLDINGTSFETVFPYDDHDHNISVIGEISADAVGLNIQWIIRDHAAIYRHFNVTTTLDRK